MRNDVRPTLPRLWNTGTLTPALPFTGEHQVLKLARLVALQQKRLGFLHILVAAYSDLKITSTEMSYLAHVARKSFLECDAIRIHLHVHKDVLTLGVYLDAGEVLDASEGAVVLERLRLHVVT